jgi:hypothetical protein
MPQLITQRLRPARISSRNHDAIGELPREVRGNAPADHAVPANEEDVGTIGHDGPLQTLRRMQHSPSNASMSWKAPAAVTYAVRTRARARAASRARLRVDVGDLRG